jgi:hypothetical protein
VVFVLRHEDRPLVADALHRGHRHREDRRAAVTDRQGRGRRHSRTQQAAGVPDVDTNRHGARFLLDQPADLRDAALEILARQRREGEPRRRAGADTNGVALEGVHGEPERGQIADAERRRRRIEHLADHRGAFDHRSGHRRCDGERRRRGTLAVVGGRLDTERRDGGV